MTKRQSSAITSRRLVKTLFENYLSIPPDSSARVFLLEWSKNPHDSLVYAATHLGAAESLGTRSLAYWPDFFLGVQSRLWARVAGALLVRFYGSAPAVALRQLGIRNLVVPGLTTSQRRESRKIFREMSSQFLNLNDFEGQRIDGVLVGDLFYDSALKDLRARTVPFRSCRFKRSLLRSIALYIFWRDWLGTHQVAGVAGRHATYRMGLVLRQASHRGAVAMQIGRDHFSKILPSNPWHGPDYGSFRTIFSSLPVEKQREALKIAEKSLEERLQGQRSEATHYLRESAYGPGVADSIFGKTGRPRTIVFTHAFFDAPHAGGSRIFSDYWQWLTHIGRLSESSDYEWFIKPHPNGKREDKKFLADLVKQYDSLNLMPRETSNAQILIEGCDLAFTLYGSVAVEFAWRGVPVINGGASPNRAYNFAYHPRDVEHFDRLVQKLPELKVEANRKDILEFEFMHNYFYGRSILFKGVEDELDYFTRNPHLAEPFMRRSVQSIADFINSEEKALPVIDWRGTTSPI